MKIIVEDRYKVIINKNDLPWLTMVHGFSHNYGYFQDIPEIFSSNFNIFLPNLIGHGSRYKDSGPFGFEEYAKDIESLWDELEIRESSYWGTHTGAAVGLIIATRSPEKLSQLLLEGAPVPGFIMPKVEQNFEKTKSIYNKSGLKVAMDHWVNNSEWFSYMNNNPKSTNARAHRMLINEFRGKHFIWEKSGKRVTNVLENFGNFKKRTILYNGEFDLDEFKHAAKTLYKLYPNIELKIIKNCGGFPLWENKIAVLNAVKDILLN